MFFSLLLNEMVFDMFSECCAFSWMSACLYYGSLGVLKEVQMTFVCYNFI